MNMPGFTAEYSLVSVSGGQKSGAWAYGVAGVHLAAIPVHCGPCQRDAEHPDVCEKTCCRVGRIDDDGTRDCFTRPCTCPPCGSCERDPGSPTGASVTCCYESATNSHPAGCSTRPCAAPKPKPEEGPYCGDVVCSINQVCTDDGCCPRLSAFEAESGKRGRCQFGGPGCRCRYFMTGRGQCTSRSSIDCGDGTCCPAWAPNCASFGGLLFCAPVL